MNKVRLIPVVIMAVSALLVLKTMGIMTSGGYVLTGVSEAVAAGGGGSSQGPTTVEDHTITLAGEPTLNDAAPTLSDSSPTMSAETPGDVQQENHGGGGTHNPVALNNACAPQPVGGENPEAATQGQLYVVPGDCPPLTDATAQLLTPAGAVPLADDVELGSSGVLAERLGERRDALESLEQELAMRAALVEAAEKRIDERQATLQSIENQISSLVEQRKSLEEGQFAQLVAMYGTMKPKDAAAIFDELDMDVLLRVAKMMSPRKMAPIMAAMTTSRAQELTVRMATEANNPLEQMTPDDLAALPQIIGQ